MSGSKASAPPPTPLGYSAVIPPSRLNKVIYDYLVSCHMVDSAESVLRENELLARTVTEAVDDDATLTEVLRAQQSLMLRCSALQHQYFGRTFDEIQQLIENKDSKALNEMSGSVFSYTYDELRNAINKEIEERRAHINIENQREFCGKSEDAYPPGACHTARISAVKFDKKHRMKLSDVDNTHRLREMRKRTRDDERNEHDDANFGMNKRLENLEHSMGVTPSNKRDIYQRLKDIEDRMLILEAHGNPLALAR